MIVQKVNIHYPEEAFDYAAITSLGYIYPAIERLFTKQALVIDERFALVAMGIEIL